jgi:CheY-like chemotaxis protein
MGEKISVLVVEDEAIVRLDIVDQLEEEGFTVYEAANADEAIACLATTPAITVLFTDVDMPGSMNGLKLAGAVRDRWPPVKIIVTSGHRMVDSADLPAGSRFFSKPYSHRQLINSVLELAG